MDWTIWPSDPVIGEWPWRVDPAAVVCRATIECDPVPWSRAGRGRVGQSFTPKRVKDHEELVAGWMKIGWRSPMPRPFAGALGLVAFFFVTSRRRRDRDNFLKLIQDAGNEEIWLDDSQVVEGFERIFYAPARPRTELLIYRTTA
jgi:Holliday junction resolvase RusA-like endonuclease